MQKTVFKELKIKLPSDLTESISEKEVISMIMDMAISKAEYYRSRCKEMEEKYGSDITSFKKKIEEADKEMFSEWDDLIIWEGYELGYNEWERKYEELKGCMV